MYRKTLLVCSVIFAHGATVHAAEPDLCAALKGALRLGSAAPTQAAFEQDGKRFPCGLVADGSRWVCAIHTTRTCTLTGGPLSDGSFKSQYAAWVEIFSNCFEAARIVPIDYRRWEDEADIGVTLGKRYTPMAGSTIMDTSFVVARMRQQKQGKNLCSSGRITIEVAAERDFQPFD